MIYPAFIEVLTEVYKPRPKALGPSLVYLYPPVAPISLTSKIDDALYFPHMPKIS